MNTENNIIKAIDSYFIRGCFILPLGAFGIMHLINPPLFEYMVPHFLGSPRIWVYLSGILLTGTSISIFLKKWSKLSSLLLIIFVLVFILTVDIPFVFSAHLNSSYFLISWMKDTSLLAGSLIYFNIHRYHSGSRYSF